MDNYNKRLVIVFNQLKSIRTAKNFSNSAISIEQNKGWLAPVCHFLMKNPEVPKLLSSWRKENVSAFFSIFRVNENSTKIWLNNILLKSDDRLLFLVMNNSNEYVGHIGFSNCINDSSEMELDSVLKGVAGNLGIMQNALYSMIIWAQQNITPKSIFLNVFKRNARAISMYENIGFLIEYEYPLFCNKMQNDIVRFESVANNLNQKPDEFAVRMRLTSEPIQPPRISLN